MDTMTTHEAPVTKDDATVERTSDLEIVVSRTVRGTAAAVYQAWTRAELFQRWWVPKSYPITLLSCELDVRVGGRYRLVFGYQDQSMEFFGRYLEVTAPSRLVWTNEEGAEGGQVTTATFEEVAGGTRVVIHDRYPSKESLDEAIASGSATGPECLAQLDALLVELDGVR